MAVKLFYTWDDLHNDVDKFTKLLTENLYFRKYDYIAGVPRGGNILASLLSSSLHKPQISIDDIEGKQVLICDDIVDSGSTRNRFSKYDFLCIHFRSNQKDSISYGLTPTEMWVVYPWEKEEQIGPTENIKRLLEFIGEDPEREGLRETPDRVIKSYDFLCSGYSKDPMSVIKTFSSETYDQMILLKDIEMYSLCEHHMLPFFGKAHIAYIPNGRVIGVSKLARLLEIYCRRLQIQERIGEQVTTSLMEGLNAKGAACIIEANHLCMRMRGVEKQNSTMITSSLKGIFLDKSMGGVAAREELMRLIK